MNGVLKIVTKLENKQFKGEVEKMKKDVGKGVEIGDFKSSIASISKFAKIVAVVAVLIGGVAKAIQKIKEENGETLAKAQGIANFFKNLLNLLLNGVANLLMPLIEKIINGVYTLLQYVNYLTKAWFNIDLFASDTTKNLDKSNKSAKNLKKTLSGFDEINTISSNNQDTTPAGGSSPTMPNVEIPSWLVWIKDNGSGIAVLLLSIAAACKVLGVNLGLLQLGGILLIITGIFKGINDISELISNPSWSNFGKVVTDIGLIALGVGLLFGGLPVIIGGALAIVWGLIITHWNKIKNWLQNDCPKVIKIAINAVILILNGLITSINAMLLPLRAIIYGAGKIAGKNWDFADVRIPSIPYLAKGGIVDLPGRGINIGGAIAGEAGAEAVLPLTDDTLQRLANKMTVTVNLTNKLDSRVLNNMLIEARNNQSMLRGGAL